MRSPCHNLRHNLPQCAPRLSSPPHYMRAPRRRRCAACAPSPSPRADRRAVKPPRVASSSCLLVSACARRVPPYCPKSPLIIISDRTASRRTAAQGSNVRIIARRTRATKSATSSPSSRTIIQYHIVKHATRCHTLTDYDRLAQGERIEANKKPRRASARRGCLILWGCVSGSCGRWRREALPRHLVSTGAENPRLHA